MGSQSLLSHVANLVVDDWNDEAYHDRAEAHMDDQWSDTVWPFLRRHADLIDWSVALDLAAGRGRSAAKLLPLVNQLYVVDVNAANIEACAERFAGDGRVTCHVNDGFSLPFIPEDSLTFGYCFDSMIHFDSDIVRAYLAEFARVLTDHGRVFLHHSNYDANPTGTYRDNPGWRDFMSHRLLAHYARKEGLTVVEQQVLDWTHDGSWIDCFSLLGRA